MKKLAVLLFAALAATAMSDPVKFPARLAIAQSSLSSSVVSNAFPNGLDTLTTLPELAAIKAENPGFPTDTHYLSVNYAGEDRSALKAEFDSMAADHPWVTTISTNFSAAAFENMCNLQLELGRTNYVEVAREVGGFGLYWARKRLDLLAKLLPDLDFNEDYRKAIVNNYLREVKIHLRKQGKSFVEKDGVNPLKPYMDGLSDALNAPRLGNINELMAAVGHPEIVFDVSFLPSDDKVKDIIDAVMIDEIKVGTVKNTLRLCLGLDEYNKFVDEYNNGTGTGTN